MKGRRLGVKALRKVKTLAPQMQEGKDKEKHRGQTGLQAHLQVGSLEKIRCHVET